MCASALALAPNKNTQTPAKPRKPLVYNHKTRLIVYSLVIFVIFAMFVTSFTRHSALRASVRLKSLTARRNFFFSARSATQNTQKPPKTGTETGWTGSELANAATPASAANLAVSTAYNYDQASFDRLLAYQVAVLFQPKTREPSNVFTRKAATESPAAILPSGEDNLFVSAQGDDGYIAVGVADGVGGWSEAGYDSSAILRELCHVFKTNFEAVGEKKQVTPKELLVQAFHDVQQSPKVEIGGTTACVGILTPDRKLRVANLGDSWCGLFRNHKLVKETLFQTHNFNTPYQLAKIPAHILGEAARQGKRYIIDSPELCDEYVWDLQKDDVVIFATDGVTDNVVPQDIEVFLQDQFAQQKRLPEISAQLVKEVVKVSKDPNYPSAFAQELSRLTGQRYMGGKEDDITVVMVKVL